MKYQTLYWNIDDYDGKQSYEEEELQAPKQFEADEETRAEQYHQLRDELICLEEQNTWLAQLAATPPGSGVAPSPDLGDGSLLGAPAAGTLTSMEGVRRSDVRGQSLTPRTLYGSRWLTSHPGDSNRSRPRAPAQKHWGLVPHAASWPVVGRLCCHLGLLYEA